MSQIIISNGQVTIQFLQYVKGETDMIISRGKFIEGFVLDSKEAERKCKRHLTDKVDPFKVVSINGVAVNGGKVVKAAAPKEPEAKSKRFIYCKESRKIWAQEYSRKKTEMLAEIRPFFKDKAVYAEKRAEVENNLKAYMKQWENSKADEVNEMLQKQFAEKNAQ